MAHHIEAPQLSPAAELREALAELEKLLIQVNAQTVVRTLELLDATHAAMAQLRAEGVDLKAEAGLWAGFEFKIRESAGQFVAAARPHGDWTALRAAHARSEEFWWRLDEIHRQRIRRQLFRGLRWLGAAVGLVALAWVVLTYVIPPDQTAVRISEVTYDLESALNAGDFEAGRALVAQGLADTGRNAELLLWAGVLEERLDNADAAQTYFDEAFAQPERPPASLWTAIGQHRLRVGDLAGAECAALAALDLAPDFPQAHFVVASVAEARGDMARAIEYFNSTADLATDSEPQLTVIARVRLGYLMQSPANIMRDAPEAAAAAEAECA